MEPVGRYFRTGLSQGLRGVVLRLAPVFMRRFALLLKAITEIKRGYAAMKLAVPITLFASSPRRFLFCGALASLALIGCGKAPSPSATNSTPQPAEASHSTSEASGGSANVADLPASDMEEKYKALVYQVERGMTRKQVENVLGIPDEDKTNDLGKFNPQKAGQILTILTWKGDGGAKPSIILSFVNDRLQDGGTPGFDNGKGFHGQLPPNMSAEEKAKLKDALNKTGFQVDEN